MFEVSLYDVALAAQYGNLVWTPQWKLMSCGADIQAGFAEQQALNALHMLIYLAVAGICMAQQQL